MVPGITHIFVKIYRKVVEKFIRYARTDKYNIMCFIDTQRKGNPSEFYVGSSCGGYPLPLNSITEALVSLSATTDFIGFWLQGLEHNFLEISNMNFETIKNCFRKPQLNFLNLLVIRKNTNLYYMILEVVGT